MNEYNDGAVFPQIDNSVRPYFVPGIGWSADPWRTFYPELFYSEVEVVR